MKCYGLLGVAFSVAVNGDVVVRMESARTVCTQIQIEGNEHKFKITRSILLLINDNFTLLSAKLNIKLLKKSTYLKMLVLAPKQRLRIKENESYFT